MKARTALASVLTTLFLCVSALAEVACPKCGTKYPEEAKFCTKDGTKLVKAKPKCLKCSKELPGSAKFCPGCGAAVKSAKAAAGSAETPSGEKVLREAWLSVHSGGQRLPGYVHYRIVERPAEGRRITVQEQVLGPDDHATLRLVEDRDGKPISFTLKKADKRVAGTIQDGTLRLETTRGGKTRTEMRAWNDKAVFLHDIDGSVRWPTSAEGAGGTIQYPVYDATEDKFAEVTATFEGHETKGAGRVELSVIRIGLSSEPESSVRAFVKPNGVPYFLEVTQGGATITMEVEPKATVVGVPEPAVKGEHVKFSNDVLEFKADLSLLPNNAFPPAFTCLIGRQLTPEKLAGYLLANLPREQRAQAMRKALADMKKQPTQGDTDLSFAKMSFKNVSDGPLDLRVSVRVARFSEPAATTVRLAKGERKIVRLSPVFSDAVMGLTEERMTNVSIRVEKTGGGMILERTLPLRVLSCNDMVWTAEEPFDCMFLIAVFVTPRDSKKAIDTLMREAVERTPFASKSMVGYQEQEVIKYRLRLGGFRRAERKRLSHREVVEAQAKAIYDAIKARGVKYVSTPISFAAGAQRVKYADEILADRSGNCIETTVLFASAFEAMGMHPIVILVPGHAFVGVKPWKWGTGPEAAGPPIVIETTMVGSDSYEAARKRADATYAKHQRAGDLRMIAIDLMRHLGVPPATR